MVERGDENLPVADLPGPCSSRNGLDDAIRLLARHRDLHAQLGQEIHGIFGAAVDFRVPLLSPVAFYFRDRHTAYPESGERLPDFVELERLDDRDDELHNGAPLCVLRRPTREPAFAEHLWPRCGRPVQTNYSNDLFKRPVQKLCQMPYFTAKGIVSFATIAGFVFASQSSHHLPARS